jgi:hypothetical protein
MIFIVQDDDLVRSLAAEGWSPDRAYKGKGSQL